MRRKEKFQLFARRAGDWLRRYTWPVAALTLLFGLLLPRSATCQFFSPCCAELALGLSQINGSLISTVAGGLNQIHAVEKDVRTFEQTVLYPVQLIAQTRTAIGQIWGQVRSVQSVLTAPLQTATLPIPQQLETTLLSRDASQISNLGARFQQLYGPVPAANTAAPKDIDTIDISDAVSQDAMKRAVVYDEMADKELEAADQMQAAINAAAPGTAPMIEASAAAWLVKSQAYTQSALADLMRVNGIALANTGGGMKSRSASTNDLFDQMLHTTTTR
jgi:hypothetical protein